MSITKKPKAELTGCAHHESLVLFFHVVLLCYKEGRMYLVCTMVSIILDSRSSARLFDAQAALGDDLTFSSKEYSSVICIFQSKIQ